MSGSGLSLVVPKGDNSITDKVIICWWHLRKRSPCKFLNNSKLCQEILKCLTGQKGNEVSKMPQQSLNKILDLRITGTWICKKQGCRFGSCLQRSQVQIHYCDNTPVHRSHALPRASFLQQVLAEGELSRFPIQMPSPKAKT